MYFVAPSDIRSPFARRFGQRASDSLPPVAAACKRIFDVVASLVFLVLVTPLLLVAALAIKLDSRGPVFFRQTRVGRDGRTFRIWKLRTMRTDADDSAHRAYVAALIRGEAEQRDGMFKLVDDPRITKVGHVLRRFSIDELPQLLNVLAGDMSIVGPRPPLESEVALYPPRAWDRLRVRPGLTGLWQVTGRCETTFEEMVDLDVRYWRCWSPLLELKILVRTPVAVLSARGAA